MQKVVIITRTKDRPLLLQRSLRSVLGQSFQNWLHVIVNDGGDPVTVDGIVARFAQAYGDRAKVIHNEKSVGMQNASNIAIQATDSEYIVIHDDDDSWTPVFLEECVKHLDHVGPEALEQGVAVQSTWVLEEIDSWGNIVELSTRDYLPFEAVNLFQTAGKNAFPPIAFMYRRKVHQTIGFFDQTFNELGDWDFNLRFLCHYDIGVINRRLANYHWRRQGHGSGYGNTATEGVASHRQALVRMQNYYLRLDLANQRMGLGVLLNVAGALETQAGWFTHIPELLHGNRRLMQKVEHFERITSDLTRIWKLKASVGRASGCVMDIVAQMSRNMLASKGRGAVNSEVELESPMRKAKVVSVDVFDTALLRLVRKPTDLFLYIQNDARRLLDKPTLRFVEARVAAEEESRRDTSGADISGETTLERIYTVLGRKLGCADELVRQIQKLEVEAEYKLCYANPEIASVVQHSADIRDKIVFTSDMYLPSGEIKALLQHNGFDAKTLFLSSELSVTKHHGALFDHVVARCECQPGEIFHIGDNHRSDVESPRAKGIVSYHWMRHPSQVPLVDQLVTYSGSWEGDLASSLYTGLARRRRLSHPLDMRDSGSFWDMIGYEVIGPLYLSFVSWVIARAQARGMGKLFFLARDGFPLVKVFDLLRDARAINLKAEYLFASRRLWNVPRITKFDEESVTFLVTPNPCMRAGDFLKQIGIDSVPYNTLARQFEFTGLDQPITTKDGVFISEECHQNMRRFVRHFEGQILGMAQAERAKLLRYFNEAGLCADDVGIVDIGWQASSLKSLHDLLRSGGWQPRVPGFYFGTWHFARPVVDAGCQIESFFVHLDQPRFRAEIVMECVELLESFFWAPHPTIIGIDNIDGKWKPVYGESETDALSAVVLQRATNAAFEFIKEALEVLPCSEGVPLPYGYLETTLERLLRHPTKEEAVMLGSLALRNSFGGHGPLRFIAKRPSTWQSVWHQDLLQDAYDHCYWKKGFLAQLSNSERSHLRM